MRRGEVWWVNQNPIIPRDPHLPRPVVIVSPDNRNKAWNSVIVVPCSTGITNPNDRFHIPITKGIGGIPKDCHARCDLISNIEKSCFDTVKGALSQLPAALIWDIVRGIRWSIGETALD